MRKIIRNALIVAVATTPAVAIAQMNMSSKPATYITKEEVDAVNKTPGVDRTIRVMDIGPENFSVGIIHRGTTHTPPPAAGAAGRGAAAAAQAQPCGMSGGGAAPAGTPSGIAHDSQTEGYLIVSGAGEMVTGGHIMNGRKSAADAEVTTTLNGPSCSGSMMGNDVVKKQVKVGDIIIIPAGTPHGWSDIPDHVDYLSFRPSQKVLTAGYVNPAIKK